MAIRRRTGALIALVVVVALLVAAVIVVEIGGRAYARDYIRDQLIASFPGTDPVVTIGPGSIILQAIGGSFDSVDVEMADVTIGTFTGDVSFAATDAPFDDSKPIGALRVGVDVGEAEAQEIVRGLQGFDAASVAIDGDLAITSSLKLLALTVPYGINLAPTADSGDLLLTPTSVSLNNATIAAKDLSTNPIGKFIVGLVKPQRVCVAQYLPSVLTLNSVEVEGDILHLTADATDIVLAMTDFEALGSCG